MLPPSGGYGGKVRLLTTSERRLSHRDWVLSRASGINLHFGMLEVVQIYRKASAISLSGGAVH
jgi:hypothetical protein